MSENPPRPHSNPNENSDAFYYSEKEQALAKKTEEERKLAEEAQKRQEEEVKLAEKARIKEIEEELEIIDNETNQAKREVSKESGLQSKGFDSTHIAVEHFAKDGSNITQQVEEDRATLASHYKKIEEEETKRKEESKPRKFWKKFKAAAPAFLVYGAGFMIWGFGKLFGKAIGGGYLEESLGHKSSSGGGHAKKDSQGGGHGGGH